MGRLKGKLAIITGGLGDLGHATGRRLAEGGENARASAPRLIERQGRA